MKNRRKISLLNATKLPSFQVHGRPFEGFCKKILPFEGIFHFFALALFSRDWTPMPGHNGSTPPLPRSNIGSDKMNSETIKKEGNALCKRLCQIKPIGNNARCFKLRN